MLKEIYKKDIYLLLFLSFLIFNHELGEIFFIPYIFLSVLLILLIIFNFYIKSQLYFFTDYKKLIFFYSFIIWTIYVFLITLFLNQNFDKEYNLHILLLGFIKTLIMPFLALFSYIYLNNKNNLKFLFIAFLIFMIFAGIIQYIQYFVAPFEFFAKYSSRYVFGHHFFRFGSLLGSITIAGVAYPLCVVISYFFVKEIYLRFFLIFIFILFTLLSTQKAGLINLFILAFFYSLYFIFIILKKFSKFKKKFLYFFLISFSLFFITFLTPLLLNFFENPKLSAISFFTDLYIRLFISFVKLLNYHGFLTLIFGVGYEGYGSALGIEGGQAHNSLWDLVLSGGLIYGLIASIIILSSISNIFKNLLNKVDIKMNIFFLIIIFMFVLNLLSTSLAFFHPFTSFPFWITVMYLYRNQNE